MLRGLYDFILWTSTVYWHGDSVESGEPGESADLPQPVHNNEVSNKLCLTIYDWLDMMLNRKQMNVTQWHWIMTDMEESPQSAKQPITNSVEKTLLTWMWSTFSLTLMRLKWIQNPNPQLSEIMARLTCQIFPVHPEVDLGMNVFLISQCILSPNTNSASYGINIITTFQTLLDTTCYNFLPFSCLLPCHCSMPPLLLLCSPTWGERLLLTCFSMFLQFPIPTTLVFCFITGLSFLLIISLMIVMCSWPSIKFYNLLLR